MLANARISPLFTATAQATEEAIVNALLAAETMTGANDRRVRAAGRSVTSDHEEVRAVAEWPKRGTPRREAPPGSRRLLKAELPLRGGSVTRLTLGESRR